LIWIPARITPSPAYSADSKISRLLVGEAPAHGVVVGGVL
jgi:hypothetical protein